MEELFNLTIRHELHFYNCYSRCKGDILHLLSSSVFPIVKPLGFFHTFITVFVGDTFDLSNAVCKQHHRAALKQFLNGIKIITGADPGLVVGGGANLLGGRRPNILIHFLKNSMKLKKFWSVEGGACRERPPKSATELCTLTARVNEL